MINYAYINLKKMIHPNAVISLKIGNKNVEKDVASSVWRELAAVALSLLVLRVWFSKLVDKFRAPAIEASAST